MYYLRGIRRIGKIAQVKYVLHFHVLSDELYYFLSVGFYYFGNSSADCTETEYRYIFHHCSPIYYKIYFYHAIGLFYIIPHLGR